MMSNQDKANALVGKTVHLETENAVNGDVYVRELTVRYVQMRKGNKVWDKWKYSKNDDVLALLGEHKTYLNGKLVLAPYRAIGFDPNFDYKVVEK